MIVKIGGLREPKNFKEVCKLDVDWVGFNFCKDSPRFLAQISSRGGFIPDYTTLKDEQLTLGKPVDKKTHQMNSRLRVGTFIDDMPQTIVTRIYNFKLDFVQLDGTESRIMIENLRRTIEPDIRTGVKIIKTIHISSAADFERCAEYEGVVDYFLFNAPVDVKDFKENSFDWNLLGQYKGKTPFLIGGAIGSEDVERLRAFSHPLFVGVDVNDKFETEPGVIDIEAFKAFLQSVKS